MAHDVRRYSGGLLKTKLASFGLIVAEGGELVECAGEINLILCPFIVLLYHAEMPQGFPDGGFFLGRAVGNDLVFLLGEVIMLAGVEA